jgi:hypothetical protein
MASAGVKCIDCEQLTSQACEDCGQPYCGCSSDTDDAEKLCAECQAVIDDDDDDEYDEEDEEDDAEYDDDDEEEYR